MVIGKSVAEMDDLPESTRGKSQPISEILFGRPTRTFGAIASISSNTIAVEAALQFSILGEGLVALVGPTGWGKSHLLEAAAQNLTTKTGEHIEVVSAVSFIANPSRYDNSSPLILDNAEEVLVKARTKILLRLALERRVRAQRPTMLSMTMPKVTRGIRSFLPSVHEWVVAEVAEPTTDERARIIEHLAEAEGLVLSKRLVYIIAKQMHGNGRTLAGALKRLRVFGSEWIEPQAILQACGTLDPFFADCGAWDLRMKILRVTEATISRFGLCPTLDWGLYVMLKVAGLCEVGIAEAAKLEPGEVYVRTTRLSREIESNPELRPLLAHFIDCVVESLANDGAL